MNDDELANVLDRALTEGRYERDDLYLFDTKLAWMMTNEAHVRDPQRAMVWSALQAHPDIAPLLGKYLNSTVNSPQLTAPALGDWLLTRAFRIGATGAVAELRSFVNSPHCDVEEYLAFSGLQVDSAIALSEGLDLLSISSLPESVLSISLTDPDWSYFARDARGHVRRRTVTRVAGFGEPKWHVNPHVATAALRIRRKGIPKVVDERKGLTSSADAMHDILMVLATATCTAMFPVAHWMSPTPATPLWDQLGWSFWSHLNALRPFVRTTGEEASIVAAVKAWEAFPAELKPALKVPLDRLNRGLAAPSAVDCAIDIGVSLEALLLQDLQPNDQISLAFRLRGAWLLGTSPSERTALAQDFNAIYSCRSTAVHSGRLPTDKFTVPSGKVSSDEFMTTHARSVAARAVLKVIERAGFPDWRALLVGEGA